MRLHHTKLLSIVCTCFDDKPEKENQLSEGMVENICNEPQRTFEDEPHFTWLTRSA